MLDNMKGQKVKRRRGIRDINHGALFLRGFAAKECKEMKQ